jgi:hypothetical protein
VAHPREHERAAGAKGRLDPDAGHAVDPGEALGCRHHRRRLAE